MIIYAVIMAVVLVLVMGYGWIIYNRIIKLTNNINESWANIVASLAKRHSAIPQLINAVGDSSGYEANLQKSQAAIRSQSIEAVNEAETAIQKNLIAAFEAQPNLTVDKNYKKLLDELVEVENEIQANRLLFNRAVALYRRQLGAFPSGVFAAAFGYTNVEFFEVDSSI